MTGLLEAALDWAAAEMDLRPPNACMPQPLALLRERVVSAIENVKFYAELYRPYGDPPRDLQDFIEWYSLLPVVSRTDFEEVPVEDRVSAAYASAPLVRKQTSGSTGIPLVIFIDEKVASFRSWRFRRPHLEAGEASPTSLEFLFPERFRRDKQVRVVGTSGAKDVSTRTERSYSTLTDALKSPELIYTDLAGKSPTTLIGYASSIVRLAEWMGSAHPLPSVKRIWTTSEMLTPDGREAIRRAFGFEPREAYASVEFGFMGWQTMPDGPFTLETDRLVFQGQSLGTGGPSEAGELARVIVSDLLNDTTPLLRYDIGDLAIMSEPAGLCSDLLRVDRGAARQGHRHGVRRCRPTHRAVCHSRLPQGDAWAGAISPDLPGARAVRAAISPRPLGTHRARGRAQGPARHRRRPEQGDRATSDRHSPRDVGQAQAHHQSQHHRG